ncbi:MAG TPA: nitroreductase/quinone reductase family protein [Candidatus Deferrimicrobiaceae bacterium]|nr:nitroreductase/quinone reductase family protein [Candidatus Deferrimicrobiaceae bacterium]
MIVPRPLLRAIWAANKAIDRLSGGRLSTYRPTDRRVGVLFLTTIGRRSGQPRRNAIYYVHDGSRFAVVASNAGADADPAWWLNLQATPEATVEVGRRSIPVRAHLATEAEHERLWPELVRRHAAFGEYARATPRPIPVVILEP